MKLYNNRMLNITQLNLYKSNSMRNISKYLPNKLSSSLRYLLSSQTIPARSRYFSQLQAKQLLQQPNQLREMMIEHLNMFGQIKLESYWKTALTNQQFGYYSSKNVFSTQGDFTTSPEISSLFGEMVAVWIVNFLNKVGIISQQGNVLKQFRIVQLGPGRGLLMRDIVKSFKQLGINNYFDLTFIEVSQYNRKSQQQHVMDQFKKYDQFFRFEYEKATDNHQRFVSENQFKEIQLNWVTSLQQLLKKDTQSIKAKKEIPLTVFIANQFFDALPTTIIQYSRGNWRQKVLKKSKNPQLFFQLGSSQQILSQKLTPQLQNPKQGTLFEISPQSAMTMDSIAKVIQRYGGAMLNIDYGDDAAFTDSIRAIKDHKYIPSPYFWQVPGKCDLSAYVNFKVLAEFAQRNTEIKAYNVIPQGYFLQAMGINPRIEMLSKNMAEDRIKRLQSEYNRLVLPKQMGEIYKVQIITKKKYGAIYPHIDDQNIF